MWRAHEKQAGFTIVEMVVTLAVMSLFVTLLFQLYLTGISQQNALTYRNLANNIALSNLKKITSKTSPLLTSVPLTCNSTTDRTVNASASALIPLPVANQESLGTLPSPRDQTITAFYPRGCGASMPVQVISTVSYGTESVSYAGYVN